MYGDDGDGSGGSGGGSRILGQSLSDSSGNKTCDRLQAVTSCYQLTQILPVFFANQ